MGYYMGDASAARHQGGLFSFIGKAIHGVAKIAGGVLPFPASGLARLVAGGSSAALPSLAAQFVPSQIPGVTPMASTSPLAAPISTPPVLRAQLPAARKKAPRNLAGKTLRVSTAARQRAHRLAVNRATRARLTRAGY